MIENQREKITPYWLLLGVTAIAIAGLYSVLLVLLRTPFLYEYMPYKEFFRSALIVHVDLSVLVWFFAIQSALLGNYINSPYISKIALILAVIGTLILAISPFYKAVPLLNNYVPILQNFLFAFGLALFTCGILISNVCFLFEFIFLRTLRIVINHQSLYAFSSSVIMLVALACIYVARYKLQQIHYLQDFGLKDYFERLFWGGGHILQFFYTQLMQFAWILLYNRIAVVSLESNKFLVVVALINMLAVLPMLVIVGKIDIDSAGYIIIFTKHMRYFAGIAPTLLAAYLLAQILKNIRLNKCCFEFSALTVSMLLFFIGGIISFFINQSNTIIPAHYHGSIIGVTVALMGLSKISFEEFGFSFIKSKLVIYIPYLYFVGQLMHILGLAVSGGYGALRKTPGEPLATQAQLALGFMGVGGLVALIGGLLFVYICYSAFFYKWFK